MIAKASLDNRFSKVYGQVVREMDAQYSACSTSCRESVRWKLTTIQASGILEEIGSPVAYLRRALENADHNYFRPFVRWSEREQTSADFETTFEQQLTIEDSLDLNIDIEAFRSALTLVERHAFSTLAGGVKVSDAAANASISEQGIYKARDRVKSKARRFFRSYEYDRN